METVNNRQAYHSALDIEAKHTLRQRIDEIEE